MGICVYISISLVLAFLITWIFPILDNISSVYPSIILIEGTKPQNDPPLYSALLKTLQHLESTSPEIKQRDSPLYEDTTQVLSLLSSPSSIDLILLKSVSSDFIGDNTEIRLLQRPTSDFFITQSSGWAELWLDTIPGYIYFFATTKGQSDMLIIYELSLPQSILHVLRYYPSRYKNEYHETIMPGTKSIHALSIYGDLIVYSVDEGFYNYHTMRKVMNESGEISWEEIGYGSLHNRKNYTLSETTALKLVEFNDTIYMLKAEVKTSSQWKDNGKLSLDILSLEGDEWYSNGILYNLSLSDHFVDTKNPEEVTMIPRIRSSNENLIYIGHYGMSLFLIEALPNSFQAYHLMAGYLSYFNKIAVSQSGLWAVLVIPGYSEKERLKAIKVEKIKESYYERVYEIALDHLPSALHEKRIKDVNIIEKDKEVFAIIFYSNGVVVIVDFNQHFGEENEEDVGFDSVSKAITLLTFVGMFMYLGYGRQYLRRNNA